MLLATLVRHAMMVGGPPPRLNTTILKALDNSIKFDLDFDPLSFQKDAFADVNKFMELARTFARLPAELCWLEHPVDADNQGGEITRMGFLLRGDDRMLFAWQARVDTDGMPRMAPYELGIDLLSGMSYVMRKSPYYRERLSESFETDTTASCLSVITSLCIINSPRVTQQEQKTVKEPVTRRRIAANLPLYTHKIIRLKFGRPASSSASVSSGNKNIYRAHLVRGHYKITAKSGLRWWNPFVRGNAKLGIITKDYVVDSASQTE